MRSPLPRLEASLWLTATVLLVGPISVGGPGVGLDASWATALNLSREAEMRAGRELIFTYGPWGFLDSPLALTRAGFVSGLSFSIGSVIAVWLLIRAVLGSTSRPNVKFMVVSLLAITFSSVTSPSFLFTVVAVGACVHHLRQAPAVSKTWCPVMVSTLAALLLQIKFSEGIAVTVFALMTGLASPRAKLLRTATSVASWLVTSSVLWVAAGQSLSDVGSWLRESTELTLGYTSAMSEELTPVVSILWHLMALLLMVSILVLGWRRSVNSSIWSHSGSLVVTAGGLLVGFKQGFTRLGVEHNAAFFVTAALLLCVLFEWGPRWRATAMLVAFSSLLASPAISTYVRGDPTSSWVSAWRIMTSDESRSAVLDQARREDQAEYGLPRTMVEATRGHAVSVDPWEVSLVWAYSMRWRPMPVFQNYAAYTAHLDELNASSARHASGSQMIIRSTTMSTVARPTLIDNRNPMWESPRYTLAAVCNYSVVTADRRWMLLRKRDSTRCGDPSRTTVPRQVSAGQPTQVPDAPSDQIVVASFTPTKSSPLVSLQGLIIRNMSPLVASLDGHVFRLPEGLASGPLLTVLPQNLDWPAQFRDHTSARAISFSSPGKLQFQTIQLIR